MIFIHIKLSTIDGNLVKAPYDFDFLLTGSFILVGDYKFNKLFFLVYSARLVRIHLFMKGKPFSHLRVQQTENIVK